MPYVPSGRPRGRPRKDAAPLTPVPAPTVIVLDTQSPVSNLWLHDARRSLEGAEWLEKEARAAGGLSTVVVGALKLSGELRKQAAESLATAQERFKAERSTTAKGGLTILPPQTNRLLANAQKAIEKLAEAQGGRIEAKDAEVSA